MSHPFLSWWEAWLFRRLIRSKRVGAIVVKQFGEPVTWYLSDPKDPVLDTSGYDDQEDTLVLGAPPEEPEPASMLLERLYHAPDAEK
jgi:hypothetical protein